MIPKLEEYMCDVSLLIGIPPVVDAKVVEAKQKFRYRAKLCENMLSFNGASCERNEIADYTATTDENFDQIFDFYLANIPKNVDLIKLIEIKTIKVDSLSEDEDMSIIEKNVAMLRRQNERYNTRKLLNLVKEL